MTVRRPTYARMRFAIKYYRDNHMDPKHMTRAHDAIVKLAREIDLDNLKHNPRRKK